MSDWLVCRTMSQSKIRFVTWATWHDLTHIYTCLPTYMASLLVKSHSCVTVMQLINCFECTVHYSTAVKWQWTIHVLWKYRKKIKKIFMTTDICCGWPCFSLVNSVYYVTWPQKFIVCYSNFTALHFGVPNHISVWCSPVGLLSDRAWVTACLLPSHKSRLIIQPRPVFYGSCAHWSILWLRSKVSCTSRHKVLRYNVLHKRSINFNQCMLWSWHIVPILYSVHSYC